MVLAIIAVVLQMLITGVANGGTMTYETAILCMAVYAICPLISFITLFSNINGMKHEYTGKGKYITGLVFSIIGLAQGALFWLSFFAASAL